MSTEDVITASWRRPGVQRKNEDLVLLQYAQKNPGLYIAEVSIPGTRRAIDAVRLPKSDGVSEIMSWHRDFAPQLKAQMSSPRIPFVEVIEVKPNDIDSVVIGQVVAGSIMLRASELVLPETPLTRVVLGNRIESRIRDVCLELDIAVPPTVVGYPTVEHGHRLIEFDLKQRELLRHYAVEHRGTYFNNVRIFGRIVGAVRLINADLAVNEDDSSGIDFTSLVTRIIEAGISSLEIILVKPGGFGREGIGQMLVAASWLMACLRESVPDTNISVSPIILSDVAETHIEAVCNKLGIPVWPRDSASKMRVTRLR